MHSFGYRANALLTFAVTILAFMCAIASFSDNLNSPTPTAQLQVLNINRFQRKPDGDDEVSMTLNISANLQSLFTWNTKQVFVFLAAEYETPKNSLNQMARKSSRIAGRQAGNNGRRGQRQSQVEAVNQGGNDGAQGNATITPAMVAAMVNEAVTQAVAQAMQGIPQMQGNQHANGMGDDAEIPQHEQNIPPEDQVGQQVQPLYVLLERFIKQKPNSFRFAPTPIDAENWIAHLEKIFDVIGCSENQKVRLAVYKLEDDAQRWWKSLKATQGDGFMDGLIWSGFCDLFYQQYFPNADRDAYIREFVSIRQKDDETITDFIVSLWDGIIPSEEHAGFWIHTTNKYRFIDQGSNLRGRDFNLTLHWHVMPKTGKMFADKIVMTGYRLPEAYR